ncbi:titin-like, partial [Misgurnus anguillicaudatus]|uniref:titin-like n=1 Tax=Misgurnus anguillicaudatus TaxID=75329 RepID=UPI003CCF73C6
CSAFSTSTISTQEDSYTTSLHLQEQSKTFELQPESKLISQSLEKKPKKPVFVTEISSAIASAGNTAKFTVQVSGFPKPDIEWYHNGQLIKSSSVYTFVEEKEEHTLVITRITKELEGEYTCTASNQFGKSTCTSYLNVKVEDTKKREETIGQPPYFIKSIKSMQCTVGGQALFEYTVTGSPIPNVQWYRGSSHMQPSKYCFIVNNTDGSGYLMILGVRQSDGGIYTCKASNPLGETSCSAELIVFLETNLPSLPQELSTEQAPESCLFSESLSEQVRASLQQERQVIYTTSTEDRQTIKSEQTDVLHSLNVSEATAHTEQITQQAAVLQSHEVQEGVTVAPAQPKPVVVTPLKQLHMGAMTPAVQESQGFIEKHCDRILSPEIRELELAIEEPSKSMSAISESATPFTIVKAESLIKMQTEETHATSEPKTVVSGAQVEIKWPILKEEYTTILNPKEERSYRVTEGIKLLYTSTSSENVPLAEAHTSEISSVEYTKCLVEKEKYKPLLTSVSETKHILSKEDIFAVHRPVEESAQLSKESVLKSAMISEEKVNLIADETTGIPDLEHPSSVHSQKEENEMLHLQLISDQDTLVCEGGFTCEKPEIEKVDVGTIPVVLHTVSTEEQKMITYEPLSQFSSKDTSVVLKPRVEQPAALHLHSVQSEANLYKEGLLSVGKQEEQTATQRQEKACKYVATNEEKIELIADYVKDLEVTVEGFKIEHPRTESRPLNLLQVVSQPVPLSKERQITCDVKRHCALVQKEDCRDDMHAAFVSECHSLEEGFTDTLKAVEEFTCRTGVEPRVPVQSFHIEEKEVSTESCTALDAAEQDFAVKIQEGQSVRQSILIEEKLTLMGEKSQSITRSEASQINITTHPAEPFLITESQECKTLPKELTFVIPVPKLHSLDIKQQLKMTLRSAVARDQPLILADVVESLAAVEVKEVKVHKEPGYVMFTYLVTSAGPPLEITIGFEGEYPQLANLKNELLAAFNSILHQEQHVLTSEKLGPMLLDRPDQLQVGRASSSPMFSAISTENVELFEVLNKHSATLQTESKFPIQSTVAQKQAAIQESKHHVVETAMESQSFTETESKEIQYQSFESYDRDESVTGITIDASTRQVIVEQSMDVHIQEDNKESFVTEDNLIREKTEVKTKEVSFETQLKDITAEENSKVTLSVRIKHVKSVNWLFNGILIKSGQEFKCLKGNDSYTLVINKVTKEKHEGEYTCEAVSEAGKTSSSSRLTVVSRGWTFVDIISS